MRTIPNRDDRTVRHGGGIKIFKIPWHIENTPGKNRTKAKIVRDTAIGLGRAFSQGNGTDDGPGQGETAKERHLENHLIRGVPYLLIHIKSLGIDVTDAFHLAQVLEEIPEARGEVLKITIVHGYAHLIQKKGAVRLRPEGGKLSHRHKPDARNTAVLHISINMKASLHITKHLMNHIAGLGRTRIGVSSIWGSSPAGITLKFPVGAFLLSRFRR